MNTGPHAAATARTSPGAALAALLGGGRRDARGLRVLVTGASGTFGRALSARLTELGAHVVGLDLAPGPDDPVEVLTCDITDDDAVSDAVAGALARLGGLDLLINNAGIGGPAPAELPPGPEVRRDLATTRRGAVEILLARHLPWLTDRIVARTLAGRVRSGAFDGAEPAAGVVRRHGGRP
ncbi:SDR family NAD(P)-dependent oxidoreductase [Streptomyces verrucosisporus]|uniref:SDR family NAD(P)-dependent oxidoreductase n=1 Tax=Streptomyces verrucosisporus TaxID=1695161 RepID=UPI0019D204AE|nr:SDR family NAD(P)-dependent oxidoreductase [Streptomyces verrucosisporus]MBN3932314.1 SDR family NAD(P)-dependent oxidoreductase [Streptomyces verrucosisporus]